jgi:hypothetical protein
MGGALGRRSLAEREAVLKFRRLIGIRGYGCALDFLDDVPGTSGPTQQTEDGTP